MDQGTLVAIKFLRDYANFGARNHLFSASAYQLGLEKTEDTRVRKVLLVKMYQEMMSGIEDMAAIFIAIKHREEGLGIINNFMRYGKNDAFAPKTKVWKLYREISEGVNVVDYIGLPSVDDIALSRINIDKIFTADYLTGKNAKQRKINLKQALFDLITAINENASAAAQNYTVKDQALVEVYNKTKHGFVVIEDHKTLEKGKPEISDDKCWVLVSNPDYIPPEEGQAPPKLPPFDLAEINLEGLDTNIVNIENNANVTSAVCSLVASMLEVGIIKTEDNRA